MFASFRWPGHGSLALLATLALSAPAAARDLDILEAHPDSPEPGQLSIRVNWFPASRARAHVCLGESPVPLVSSVVDATEIRAALPAGLPTGTYRLTVRAVLPKGSARCPDHPPSESALFDAFDLALSDPSALEIQHALCEGGAPNPRPGICPGRCTCPPPSIGPGCTLSETSDGEFLYAFSQPVDHGMCRLRLDGNRCGSSSDSPCLQDADCGSDGQQCVAIPGTTDRACRFPCTSDADCRFTVPERTRYLGVAAPGSRNVVACEPPKGTQTISNSDARACIELLEAACAP
jgi:hypothetical protein